MTFDKQITCPFLSLAKVSAHSETLVEYVINKIDTFRRLPHFSDDKIICLAIFTVVNTIIQNIYTQNLCVWNPPHVVDSDKHYWFSHSKTFTRHIKIVNEVVDNREIISMCDLLEIRRRIEQLYDFHFITLITCYFEDQKLFLMSNGNIKTGKLYSKNLLQILEREGNVFSFKQPPDNV